VLLGSWCKKATRARHDPIVADTVHSPPQYLTLESIPDHRQ